MTYNEPTPADPHKSASDLPPVDDTSGPAHQDSVKQALSEVRHTRTKSAWVGLIVGAIVLILLLVFIVQNLDKQAIQLFFWEVNLPQGVSLLIAAIAGALITAVVGGARMFQVRRAVRKA
ncbi:LapA family protein [Williamsia herbipolensis]|uniref:Lipopolysaccharide assembly protein LapA domain-containing protein n=1 Tax=Williamsia herbipolensis TaxID=1603258 RepID=A0AAU4K318_9NOCA|nr:lipopolysaccharide assembly protein LapA domain-containing protein [Williamsia herbipolensis]MCX6467726.1 lipopolysaccharide assembly protein LapA domain-containing protein [Mycobacteriales bacterium]